MSTSYNSLGTGWGGFCGTTGLPTCSNGACALPATAVRGSCVKLCGKLGGDCCTVGPACGDGTPGSVNDVDVTCFNPVVGPKNCQTCGGSGEVCCGPNQLCHVGGEACSYQLFQGEICNVPASSGGGGPTCPLTQEVCGVGGCPSGFHTVSFTSTMGCGATTVATVCPANCGPSFSTCDSSCGAGYHLTGSVIQSSSCAAPGGVGGTGMFPLSMCAQD
jgi:hypothetical protein